MKRHLKTINSQTLRVDQEEANLEERKRGKSEKLIFCCRSSSQQTRKGLFSFSWKQNCHPSDRQNQSVAFFSSVHSERIFWPLHRHNNNNEFDFTNKSGWSGAGALGFQRISLF
jgi:hypothetical protein